ncbi:MAG: iron-sulfur cluster-binding domain-containing protein [Ferruginibacter sp.]
MSSKNFYNSPIIPVSFNAFHRVQILNIITETNDAKTFQFLFLDQSQPEYKAGQFITLVFFTRHGEKRRSYSISSSPGLNEPFSITIKKVENGEFSRLLISKVKVGNILYYAGISGLFVLPQSPEHFMQYFFIAAGSGITPCYSLIKTLLVISKVKIILIYSNKSGEDTIFLNALQEIQVKYTDRIFIHFLYSNIYDVLKSRLSNWLLEEILKERLTVDPEKALFYLCGPFEYMRMANITLLNHLPTKNIIKENFNNLPRLIIPKPPDTNEHNVLIHFNEQEYSLNVQYPSSILASAKAKNIALPYSCEAGRCGSCVATCTKGKVWMAYNEVLLDEEIEKGRVLLCQAFPIDGDAEIVI